MARPAFTLDIGAMIFRKHSYWDGLARSRAFREAAKKYSFRAFLLLDRLGVHVLPKHYYSPLPDYAWLRDKKELWGRPSALPGVEWDLDRQLEQLRVWCEPYYNEVAGRKLRESRYSPDLGIGFGPPDSQVLHCFVRTLAPARIVEVGGGFSTAYMLEAAAANASENRTRSQIASIEPFPARALRELQPITLIERRCQEISFELFDRLDPGDLLFIDSTHSVKTGSELIYLYLEVIPRLKPGIYVHVHDMNLPYAYPRDALSGFWGAQEAALIVALLTNNPRLEVACSLSGLHYGRRDALQRLLPDYLPAPDDLGLGERSERLGHFPSSLWLRTA